MGGSPTKPPGFAGGSLELTRRPDTPFFGLGPRTLTQERVRYTSIVHEASLFADLVPTSTSEQAKLNEGADAPPARLVRVVTRAGIRSAKFREGWGDDDDDDDEDDDGPRDLDDMGMVRAIREGRVRAPPGFDGYVNVFQRVDLQIDTRKRRPANQTGIRLALELEHGQDVSRRSGASWFRYGGSVGGFVDVGGGRSLGLSATALFVDPLRGEVPFTEQIVFGGQQQMRGFLWNRLIDRSGAHVSLEYRWPVWMFVDGVAQLSLGNVFGPHLRDLEPRLLRLSATIGLRTSNTPSQSFELLVGTGTETFADGFRPSSARVVIGTSAF